VIQFLASTAYVLALMFAVGVICFAICGCLSVLWKGLTGK